VVTDTREYDTFGPWIPTVRTTEDVPRLYRDHPLDLAAAHSVVKVPRDIVRRDATAGMDLYDHLLALEADQLTVLSRWQDPATAGPGRYEVREVGYDQIAAVLDVVDLLDGGLHVHTRDGRVLTVSYNGAGADELQLFVDELRVLIGQVATAPNRAPAPGSELRLLPASALGRDDVGVVSAHREVAERRPGLLVYAWHGRQPVQPRTGTLRRLAHALSPATLHAGIVAGDEDAWEVFGRRDWITRGRKPVRSLSRLVLPRHALDRVEAQPHPSYAGATSLTLVAGDARLSMTVPEGSATERVLVEASPG
jgi:hypothetical protein